MKGGPSNNAKCLGNLVAFLIVLAAIVLLLAFTMMRVRSPKVRFEMLTVDSFSTSNDEAASSTFFSMRLHGQVTIKNPNFGDFKYSNGTMALSYSGTIIGDATIVKGCAEARDTKKLNVTVDVSWVQLAGTANLQRDMNSGVLMLSSNAKLPGKVELAKVIERQKSGVMACTLALNLATRGVNARCK